MAVILISLVISITKSRLWIEIKNPENNNLKKITVKNSNDQKFQIFFEKAPVFKVLVWTFL